MTLTSGEKLGRYEIRALIGVGGMGEVYRASDPKIGRDVAIKVLPADFSADKDRVARFEQEAQAAGALSHPNILPIYDIDTQDGVLYVVSELLEGEELRQRLDEGPIPLRKVTEYAQQIVSGLSAAHEKGIVHRDLKPENLFITKDDRVKILDFGLAKLRETDGNIHGSEDATRRALTNPGVVMGTVGYMSPEQVRGHAVDQRSDIFSFGVILYEMLSGSKAFHGDSVVETMNAILKEDVPEFEDENRKIPPSFEKLMRRCLEKKPEQRFYSAHDLGFALEALSAPTSSSGTSLTTTAKALGDEPTAKAAWLSRLAWPAAILFLLTTVILSALYLRRPDTAFSPIRFSVASSQDWKFGDSIAVSPDGRNIVFPGTSKTGETALWLRALDRVEAQKLAGTEGARFPFWSPDSKNVAFFANSKLKKIDIQGGAAQSLADVASECRGGTWGTEGTILMSPSTVSPVVRVSASGGEVTPVTQLDVGRKEGSHRWPYFLPDGKHFLYFARGGDKDKEGIVVASTDSSEQKFLVRSRVQGIYAPPDSAGTKGHLLFVRDGTLVAQAFDTAKLELQGDPITLAQNVQSFPSEVGPTAEAVVSVSQTGTLIFRSGSTAITHMLWVDRNGKESDPISQPAIYHEPMISPDGKKVVVSRDEVESKNQDLWMLDLARNVPTRLTFDPAVDGSAIWSPDGSTIYFSSGRAGHMAVYRKPSTGVGGEELVFSTSIDAYSDSISPDGTKLLMDLGGGPDVAPSVAVVEIDAAGTTTSPVQSTGATQHAQFSPDGRWISYASDESGRTEVYVQPFPATGGKWQISTAGGDQAIWNRNGKEIFYMGLDRRLMSVPLKVGTALEPGQPFPLFQTRVPASGITDERNNYDVTPDGQRFLINSLIDEAIDTPITVVLHWTSDLKK